MELREKIARILEPTLWSDPDDCLRVMGCPANANVEGLKECVMIKADRLIEVGIVVK